MVFESGEPVRYRNQIWTVFHQVSSGAVILLDKSAEGARGPAAQVNISSKNLEQIERVNYFNVACEDNVNPTSGRNLPLTLDRTYLAWQDIDGNICLRNDKGEIKPYKVSRFSQSFNHVNFISKKEGTMTNKTEKNGENPLNTIAQHAMHGVQVGAAHEAGELALDIVKTLVGKDNAMLATEEGRQLTKLLFASGLLYLCKQEDTFIPKPEAIANACGMIIEGSARDFIQPHIKDLRLALEQLANTGMTMSKSGIANFFTNQNNKSEPTLQYETKTVEMKEPVPVGVK